MNLKRFAWFGLLWLAGAGVASAQTWTGQDFEWQSGYSQRVDGTYGQYKVLLNAGTTYTFQTSSVVTGTSNDPYLYLLNASFALLAYDDDSAGNLNSRVVFTPSTSGTFYLRLRCYSPGYSGKCALSVTSPVTTIAVGAALPNQCFQWQPSDVDRAAGAYGQYSVSLTAGKTYSVATTAIVGMSSTDPVLYLLNSSFQIVASDDNSGGNWTSRIVYKPSTSGTFYIRLRCYWPAFYGYCTLSITENRSPVLTSSAGTTASADEGTLIAFTVSASDPDARGIASLTASYLPAGTVVSGTNPLEFRWTPGFNQGGSYWVVFTARDADGLQATLVVNITVRNVNRPPQLSVTPGTVLSVPESETVSITVTASDPDGDPLGAISAGGLTPGMSFAGSAFTFPTTWTSAGTYHFSFSVMEQVQGGFTSSVAVTLTVEDVPTADIEVDASHNVPSGRKGLLTLLKPDGINSYGELKVHREPDGRLVDTCTKIDVVIISTEYETLAEATALAGDEARRIVESITRIDPFNETDFNFWSIVVLQRSDLDGAPIGDAYWNFNGWNLAQRLIPGGAVDFVFYSTNDDSHGAAAPEARGASLPRGKGLWWAAHEFGHIFSPPNQTGWYLGDEYIDYGALFFDPSTNTISTSAFTQFSPTDHFIRLRSRSPNQQGTCTLRITPPPRLDERALPGWTQIVTEEGLSATEWSGLPWRTRPDFREPWFDPSLPDDSIAYNRGDYDQVVVGLDVGIAYTITASNVLASDGSTASAGQIAMIAGRIRPPLDSRYRDMEGPANVTWVRPWLEGEAWMGDLWSDLIGPDPNLPGQTIGWYEMVPGLYRPTHDGVRPHCQMRVGGPAPFCVVCRSVMSRMLSVDSSGTSLVRDDKGPAPSFGFSHAADFRTLMRGFQPVVSEGESLQFDVYAQDADTNTTGAELLIETTNLPPGAMFNPSTRKFTWYPGLGQAGVYRMTFEAVDARGLRGRKEVVITVEPR